jgi:glucokinase
MRVGLDIGGTKMLGVVVAADGAVVAQHREATVPGPDGVLATATTVLDRLAAGFDGVMVENDVRAATWGAHVLSGADDLGYLSIGTGLAAGFVLGGVLRRGAHGASGEIGHLPVDPDGRLCSCGQRGCLETTAAASALTAAWPADGEMSPAVALFAAAATADPAAIAVRDRFCARVADAVRVLGLAVDPATIIIGGGITDLGEPLLAAVAAALRAQADTSPFLAALDLAARLRLLPAGVPVGAVGAAMIWDAR